MEEERMKKMLLAVLIFLLLLTPTFVNVPEVSATQDDLCVAYALPEDVPCEPMPENYTAEDYLNTTNPYSQVNPLGEETDEEGSHPLYVLVFGDEEERNTLRPGPAHKPCQWDEWAKIQLERSDESLVANFGIDIRILGFLEWDSDDSLDNIYDLWYELEEDTEQYLRQWYDGEWWSGYVDAVIGITSQIGPDPHPGLSPGPKYLDQGRIFTLLVWRVYWADDNNVQHEVSHLFYADDHTPTCCVMAGHTHYRDWIWEDGLWWVFNHIPCAYTAYSWCTSCYQTIQQNSGRYPLRTLTISPSTGGTTNSTGTCIYGNGESVTVTASAYSGYTFNYWLLDGVPYTDNPITVTMNSDHTLTAYFNAPPNTPSKPDGKTSGYTGISYPYSTSTTDDDDDYVRYEFDWGDGSTTMTGCWYGSGSTATASHSWSSPGTYNVKVKAQDIHGDNSCWSPYLNVTIIYPTYLFDGDFEEGWSCSGGTLFTGGG
jgi:hypothetical protein